MNSITLRAWERRYGLIKPVRTAKGHRLYVQNDIDLIQQILILLDKGISIGQVREHLGLPVKNKVEGQIDPWAAYQQRIINAIVRFDIDKLDHEYNDVLSLYPVEMFIKNLVIPLLKSLGERWLSAEGSIAEEHFFAAYLRNKLGARFHHHSNRTAGTKFIAACMPREQHEIGLMLFCLSALDHDKQVVYLGANTPLMGLVEPVVRAQANAVLLSSSVDPPECVWNEDLPQLVQAIEVPVFIGGYTAIKFCDAIVNAGGIPLGADIQQAIKRMDEELGK